MNKFEQKDNEFEEICKEIKELFSRKNRNYGNDYFEGNYSELERWMSIRRKIARLTAHYNNGQESLLPDETIQDTWKDLAVYCIMELIMLKGEKNAK